MRALLRPGLGRAARRALRVCVLLVVAVLPFAAEPYQSLKPAGYVNDFAHILDAQTNGKLSDLCYIIDDKAGAQIAVVTVNTLEGMEAPDYANRLFAQWGVGHKKDDRGVLILLAVRDRKYWVEVGYGLEPILPDGKVGGFGREMVPYLKRGDFSGGVYLLTSRIAGTIADDRHVTLPAEARLPRAPAAGGQDYNPPFSEEVRTFFLYAALFSGLYFCLLLFRGTVRVFWFVVTGQRPDRVYGDWRDWFRRLTSGGGGFVNFGGGFGGGGFGGGGGGFGGFGGGMSGGGGAGGGW